MKKNFSIVNAIRQAANGSLDKETLAIVNEARSEMVKAGLNPQGQICIPTDARAVTVEGVAPSEGADKEGGLINSVVETEIKNILEPLYENSVLFSQATVFNGLTGNLQFPKGGKANAYWADEIAAATETNVAFTKFNMQPKRLTTFLDLSNQVLAQDGLGVENYVINQLIKAIQNKLEATVFGNDAATNDQPEGLLHFIGSSNMKTVADYAELCEAEASVSEANYSGNMVYWVAPKAKAALRSMIKGTNATGMVFEANAVDGTPAYETGFLKDKNFIYLDPKNLYVATWSGLDLVVDSVSRAIYGETRITINFYVDVAYSAYPESIVAGTIA